MTPEQERITALVAKIEAAGYIPLDVTASMTAHGLRPCHCLCSHSHPGDWVCLGMLATATRRFGAVDVPMCRPCADHHDTRRAAPVRPWVVPGLVARGQRVIVMSDPGGTAPHVHDWRETDVSCDDCGSHPGLRCADPECDEVIDLVREDDPRE